jgi:hypothetical protein
MKIAIITAFLQWVTLNEYGYHLVKILHKTEVTEVVLLADKTVDAKQLDFANR